LLTLGRRLSMFEVYRICRGSAFSDRDKVFPVGAICSHLDPFDEGRDRRRPEKGRRRLCPRFVLPR
jgi:hypothetical protein